MNLIALLAHVPLSAWISIIVSVGIPAASALLVKAHWDASITGLATLGLSTATGFFTEWVHAGAAFHWQSALAIAAISWAIAAISQSKILSGTALEGWLLSIGSAAIRELNADPTAGLDYTEPAATLAEDPATPADPEQPAAGTPPSVTTDAPAAEPTPAA